MPVGRPRRPRRERIGSQRYSIGRARKRIARNKNGIARQGKGIACNGERVSGDGEGVGRMSDHIGCRLYRSVGRRQSIRQERHRIALRAVRERALIPEHRCGIHVAEDLPRMAPPLRYRPQTLLRKGPDALLSRGIKPLRRCERVGRRREVRSLRAPAPRLRQTPQLGCGQRIETHTQK